MNGNHNHQLGRTADRLIRLREILGLIPVSKTAWYNGVKAGRYPQPIHLGPRTVAWRLSEIEALIECGVPHE
jgi:prophage regulatory protein